MNFVFCMLLPLILTDGQDDGPIRSLKPAYELTLPSGYQPTSPKETPVRYTRPRGRETWAHVSVIVTDGTAPLPQDLAGVKAAQVLPLAGLPPDAKGTLQPLRWKDFEIGAIEYHAVVKDMPVFGISAVLPLLAGTLTLHVYAPEPLEKECREEFAEVLSRVAKAPSSWHPPEYFEKIRSMDRIGMIGIGCLVLYLIVWAAVFRGHPVRAHWVRTVWLGGMAVLLFFPINSPGETRPLNNMVLNAVLPMILVLFAARRIKVGIEEG